MLAAVVLLLSGLPAFAAQTKHPKTLDYYEMTRAGLAGDDLAAAKDGATNLAQAVQEELGENKALHDAAQRLAAAATLDDARQAFGNVSAEIVKLVGGPARLFRNDMPDDKGRRVGPDHAKDRQPIPGKGDARVR